VLLPVLTEKALEALSLVVADAAAQFNQAFATARSPAELRTIPKVGALTNGLATAIAST
jgi:hypothetical protein